MIHFGSINYILIFYPSLLNMKHIFIRFKYLSTGVGGSRRIESIPILYEANKYKKELSVFTHFGKIGDFI